MFMGVVLTVAVNGLRCNAVMGNATYGTGTMAFLKHLAAH
jgi:hypothetical protein